MPEQQEAIVVNTVPSHTESDKEYARLVEAGEMGKFICGLVAIKNVSKPSFDDKSVMVPHFRLTFRSKDNPNAYVNHDVKASAKSNSKMFATVRNMTEGKLKALPNTEYADAKEIFQLMIAGMDSWFELKVEGKPWRDSVWVSVVNSQIEPTAGPEDPPSKFFDTIIAYDAKEDEDMIVFENDDIPEVFGK